MQFPQPIFKNPRHQKQFERKGYVRVKLLDTDEVAYLKEVPDNLKHTHDNGFYTTTWLTDTAVRMETHAILMKLLVPKLDAIIQGYRYHYGNYFIKKPEENSQCEVHQDWSMVDESRHIGLTIWCALDKTTHENGCIKVLKGSHTLKNYVRGRNTYDYLRPLSKFIFRYFMKDVYMEAGEAVIFNQRLIHGSGNNLTAVRRIGCGLAAVPLDAQIIHYAAQKDAPGRLRMLDAENDFYSQHNTFDPMYDLEGIETIQNEEKYLGKSELIYKYITNWFWR